MEMIEHGGWVLVVILALSFCSWILIMNKWLQLRHENRYGFDWMVPAIEEMRHGHMAAARSACSDRPGIAADMMCMALDILEARSEFSRKHRRHIIERETVRLRRYLDFIGASGAALPLLGLLGTVIGMTKTFQALTEYTSSQTNTLMAGGISEALITTQAGLVTALPVVLMYGFLSSRIRRCVDEGALAMKRLESTIGAGADHV